MRRMKKGALLLALSGTTLFAGCLGDYFDWVVQGLPGSVLTEFLLDNNGLFDLFPDDGSTSTL